MKGKHTQTLAVIPAVHKAGRTIYISGNRFGEKGIRFAFVPFMECRHSVWSMRHAVRGTVDINGQEYSFQN